MKKESKEFQDLVKKIYLGIVGNYSNKEAAYREARNQAKSIFKIKVKNNNKKMTKRNPGRISRIKHKAIVVKRLLESDKKELAKDAMKISRRAIEKFLGY